MTKCVILYRFFGNEYDQIHTCTVEMYGGVAVEEKVITNRISEYFEKLSKEDPEQFFAYFGIQGMEKVLSYDFYEIRVLRHCDVMVPFKEGDADG